MAIGIGIIGAGGISRAHARGYLQIPDEARIVGVADILEERAQAAAQEWGAEYAFGDYRELLALAEVDAVSVCTYTQAHCEPNGHRTSGGEACHCGKANGCHDGSSLSNGGSPES